MNRLFAILSLLFSGLFFPACTSTTDMHFKTSVLDRDYCQTCGRPQPTPATAYNPPERPMPMQSGPVMQQMPPAQYAGSLPPYPVQGQPSGPPPGQPMRETKVFVGGGNIDVGAFSTAMLVVITQSGTQQVKAVVDNKNLPIVAKPNQAPPPGVAGLGPDECMVPLEISTEPPGYPPIFTPVWVVTNRR